MNKQKNISGKLICNLSILFLIISGITISIVWPDRTKAFKEVSDGLTVILITWIGVLFGSSTVQTHYDHKNKKLDIANGNFSSLPNSSGTESSGDSESSEEDSESEDSSSDSDSSDESEDSEKPEVSKKPKVVNKKIKK